MLISVPRPISNRLPHRRHDPHRLKLSSSHIAPISTAHAERRSYVYEATAPDAAGIAVRDVIRAHGDAALAHFVDEARADPGVLRRLRGLLAEDA